ncbi:hypothetical protein TSAR_006726 [Trichomalopsis sarcophagae]|uniref:Uncharacterized protein n=1 Tax=Trichomalopsis sarcophagae TaxID=543379 RepID=A0A232ERD5_9HYME|nr:hypothetical protein TSAR_006726 [Trichomalopsis sarcophagae]
MRESDASGKSVFVVMRESVLTCLNHINIILGFVPDSMHLIDLEIDKFDTDLKDLSVPSKIA